FRQPDPLRRAAEAGSVVVASDEDLGAERRRMAGQERQYGVRRRAGDDFQSARVLELAQGADQVPAAGEVAAANAGVTVMIKPRQVLKFLFPMRAADLLL